MFKKKRSIYVSAEEMNQHLEYVFNYYDVKYRKKDDDEAFGRKAFIENKAVYFKLSYKKASFACTYICRKDTKSAEQQIDGGEAFRILNMYYKVPRINKLYKDKQYCGRYDEGGISASPLLWFNPKYNGTEQEAIGYDMNAAYSFAMLHDMPDTSVPMRVGTIQKGKEIGFKEVQNPKDKNRNMLIAIYEGFSLYIFPLMKSPFKKFVDKWYYKKVNSIDEKEKSKAKCVLNYSVGYLQKVNPFLRATIITICNNTVESLIDKENTLFCNTDSIVTKKPLDLKIGKGIGEWKIEHKGKVRYKDYAYQWSDGSISYRHVPKSWFPKDFNILTDELPIDGNKYKFDENLKRLVLQNENI